MDFILQDALTTEGTAVLRSEPDIYAIGMETMTAGKSSEVLLCLVFALTNLALPFGVVFLLPFCH